MKYLISTLNYDRCLRIADELHLSPSQFEFIPIKDIRIREEKLAGKHVDNDHLIGHFLDYEREYLTRKFEE